MLKWAVKCYWVVPTLIITKANSRMFLLVAKDTGNSAWTGTYIFYRNSKIVIIQIYINNNRIFTKSLNN